MFEEYDQPPVNDAIAEAYQLIRQGQLNDAEEKFRQLIGYEDLETEARLEAYSNLIRIASETRSLEKVQPYLEEIKKLDANNDGEKRKFAWCLHAIGASWHHSGHVDKAKTSFEKGLSLAEAIKDEKLTLQSKLALVRVMRLEGKFDEALRTLDKLEQTAESLGNLADIVQCTIARGDIYRKQGRYNEAIQLLEDAREKIQNKNSGKFHHIMWSLGTCFAALEDKEKAKIYLNIACNSFKGIEFWRINILSKLTLAKMHTDHGEYDLATALYNTISDEIGSSETSYFGRRLLGAKTLLHIQKSEYDKANELIDRLVITAAKENNIRELMRLRIWKGDILLRSGDATSHEEARAMLLEALAFYKERNNNRYQTQCLEILARLDSCSGYPNDALNKINNMLTLANQGKNERMAIRGELAKLVLNRKLGKSVTSKEIEHLIMRIQKVNAQSERVILSRFTTENYDEWHNDLKRLSPLSQSYVNDFFDDFHFIPNQSVDLEIDKNSSYVREKHLGEIPFHNKFTLMKLLCLLAEMPGKEYSKEDLAREIWSQEYNPLRHDNNIYININRLRKLIEPNPRESRYIMNGSMGYYFNPSMKVNISSKIADVAPRTNTATQRPNA